MLQGLLEHGYGELTYELCGADLRPTETQLTVQPAERETATQFMARLRTLVQAGDTLKLVAKHHRLQFAVIIRQHPH